jgi:asparagine synthase (glutamine-hydrolysing)
VCGINGIFAFHYAANPVSLDELRRTRDHMAPRGPDGYGEWLASDSRVGFGHRRLAIIDLSPSGAQPMHSADGALTVTFNGEIYNYRELRQALEAKGRRFRSQSDTEVLLHLYAEKGAAMVDDLRGMFAFAIWDDRAKRLFLARDPLGIKPLYYSDDGWTFRFASQVKALLAAGQISRDPDPAGVVGFHLFGSVPEPFTTYQAIRSLPAGTTLVVDRIGAGAPHRYHSVARTMLEGEVARADQGAPPPDEIRAALKNSVAAHLIADVPVGAFLSAGVDSGALVGLMRDAGANDIQTVTIGFEEFRGAHLDEAPLAQEVAKQYGTRHTTRIVTRREFEGDLPKILNAMDQPSIDGINTWFVSKAARELGLKVAISGVGGDELLGGYPSFRDIPRWTRLFGAPSLIPFLGAISRRALQPAAAVLGLNPKIAGMLELGGDYSGAYLLKRGLFMPWELKDMLDPDLLRAGLERLSPKALIENTLAPKPRSAFGRVAALEASLYMRNQLLRDTDWASMAHSLEVRTPLVDSVLLQRLSRFSGDFGGSTGKVALATAPATPLPSHIVHRTKSGFTTPIETWMREMEKGERRFPAAPQGRPTPWARDWSRKISGQPAFAAQT